jgi:V8-like Glu-specific endopeptidase
MVKRTWSRWAWRAWAATSLSLAMAASLVLLVPAAGDPVALAEQLTVADANQFSGTPAVGALFYQVGGRLVHFCTGSVVHSLHENLVITAAHCMDGKSVRPTGAITFAPGYHDGDFPYGRWVVRSYFTDREWQADQDPNDDVAFLVVGRPGRRIEKYTGAERLVTGAPLPAQVRVVGYPNATDMPVFCDAPARAFDTDHLRQMVFFCTDYTNGTSGGPFLAHLRSSSGTGQVIGVIGGYEEGGYSSSVSYSARFYGDIGALFRKAEDLS